MNDAYLNVLQQNAMQTIGLFCDFHFLKKNREEVTLLFIRNPVSM